MKKNERSVRVIEKYLDSMYGDFTINPGDEGTNSFNVYDRDGRKIFSYYSKKHNNHVYVRSNVIDTLRNLFDITIWDEDWFIGKYFMKKFNVKPTLVYMM